MLSHQPHSIAVSALDCGLEGLWFDFESYQRHVGFFSPNWLLPRAGCAMGPVGRLRPRSWASSASRMQLWECCSNYLDVGTTGNREVPQRSANMVGQLPSPTPSKRCCLAFFFLNNNMTECFLIYCSFCFITDMSIPSSWTFLEEAAELCSLCNSLQFIVTVAFCLWVHL